MQIKTITNTIQYRCTGVTSEEEERYTRKRKIHFFRFCSHIFSSFFSFRWHDVAVIKINIARTRTFRSREAFGGFVRIMSTMPRTVRETYVDRFSRFPTNRLQPKCWLLRSPDQVLQLSNYSSSDAISINWMDLPIDCPSNNWALDWFSLNCLSSICTSWNRQRINSSFVVIHGTQFPYFFLSHPLNSRCAVNM